jgi:primosomal protein N''
MKDRIYSPVPDQAKLTAKFDMDLARRNSDSFDKCWREIERLLKEGAAQTS